MRFSYLFLILLTTTHVAAQCESYPILNLGNDTLLCPGETLTLQAPVGYDSFTWSVLPGNQSSITVSTPTTIGLTASNYTPNLVVNGDFEAGNTGFTSMYNAPVSPPIGACCGLLSDPGNYAITTSPSLVHTNFVFCQDVTPTGVGNMMVVNGATTPNTTVWSQDINVDPNTDYSFSAWVTSLENISSANVAVLQFFINGVQIGPVFSPSLTGCNWQQFAQTWNSGVNTTATISIIAQVSSGHNDFAIDDITFRTVCTQTDNIVISYDSNAIDAGANTTFCENDPQTITATANFPAPNFVWETNETTASVTPQSSGWYTVTSISPSAANCILKDSVLVTIEPMPWGFDTIAALPSDCGLATGTVYTILHGPFIGQPTYRWSGPGPNSPNFINASVWQNLTPGWYYIEIENQGCYRHDSIFVDALNPPIADVTATPSSGYEPLTVTLSNNSTNGTNYTWDFGNGEPPLNTFGTESYTQVYDTVGTYDVMLIAQNGNCIDTAWVQVHVLPPPVPPVVVPVDIKTPNIFTPNGDQVNDLFVFQLLNIKELEVKVVNRWGIPVYESTGVPFVWDGKDRAGNLMEDGVYFYQYKAIGAQDEVFEGQGFVQLIR